VYLMLAAILAALLMSCAPAGQLQGRKDPPRQGALLQVDGPKNLGAVRLSIEYDRTVSDVRWADPSRVVVAARDALGLPTEVVILAPKKKALLLNYEALVLGAGKAVPTYRVQVREVAANKAGKYQLLSISSVTTRSRIVTVR
jgi:hypothetical protein